MSTDVTAVVTFHNEADVIGRCLDSIAAQTHPVGRIIVVDDGSSPDQHTLLLAEAGRHPAVEVVRFAAATGGPSAGRNRGWDMATTRWVAFCDADNDWHPRRLQVQLAALETDPDVRFVGARGPSVPPGTTWADVDGRAVPLTVADMVVRNRVATSTVLVRQDVEARFDEARNACEDLQCWLAVLAAHPGHGRVVEAPLAHEHKEAFWSSGLSSRMWTMAGAEYRTYWLAYRAGHTGPVEHLFAQTFLTVRLARRFGRKWTHSVRRSVAGPAR